MNHNGHMARRNGYALPDTIQDVCPMPPDGFAMNAALRYLPYRYFPLALSSLDFIRGNAEGYRAKWIISPHDFNIPIPALDTHVDQVRLVPGSWVWGMTFSAVDGVIADFTVQVTDPCDGNPFFSYFVNATALRASGATGTNLFPVLLSTPKQITAPGFLNIEIGNQAEDDQRCQFILLAAEPCRMFGVGPAEPLPFQRFRGESAG